jgi:hypothetical protein
VISFAETSLYRPPYKKVAYKEAILSWVTDVASGDKSARSGWLKPPFVAATLNRKDTPNKKRGRIIRENKR